MNMTSNVQKDKLQISQAIYDLVTNEVLPGTGVEEDQFWTGMQTVLEEFAPRNKELLAKRDDIQQQIDTWHQQNNGQEFDHNEYKQFLKEINYIVDEVPDFGITTENVDPEIATIAGPQLVVPINNARFSLNAANARWGSLFDAFYGTDIIPDEGALAKGNQYNSERGKKVIELANVFLDKVLPLTSGSHKDVASYKLIDKDGQKNLQITLGNGEVTELQIADSFVGYTEEESTSTLLFVNNGLHIEIQIDPASVIGQSSAAGVKDVIMESALTAIQDCEDSVAAVDAEDKALVYRNWLGLMKGTLEESFEKNGKTLSRKLNPDREYTSPAGDSFSLPGRSVLLVRNVGHLMTTDSVLLNGEEVPEGILDGLMTALIYIHDMKGTGPYKNSKSNSLYIVKPKMHGPDEVRLTVDLFAAIEKAVGLPVNTMKVGIMDEERRTTVNLKACIYEARERLIFINTGFLDRTGDEIHTSMEAGSFLPKAELKGEPWISAYEDWNVDIGLECGLRGKAQIGKGMWAMPDLMADMLEQKIQHPLAGANCAWVPSPTAATLHAMHYHYVNVDEVQEQLSSRETASLDDILTIPLTPSSYVLSREKLIEELEDNAQSMLGYVVRWIDQGVGCSKVPDTRNVELMEDRATLRISSQIISNWLHHNLCTEAQITDAFKKMAVLVDEQNAKDPLYVPMAPAYDGIAFKAALDLAIKGAAQPNGYTEPLLHHYRKVKKSA
ncbi:malate synthase G [Cocleimonas flava]|uniref:Malate synthase G n=2 Tax=Cocleimonas flava TaxID=634765 RepID=A0A4R1F381_9GAMM|nr:malate synthase G [Cocleimonas flava]TCJ86869.1 malate synthase [Cocleimonas flava]